MFLNSRFGNRETFFFTFSLFQFFLSGKQNRKPGKCFFYFFPPSLSFLILCSPFLVLVISLGYLHCFTSLCWFPAFVSYLSSLVASPFLVPCIVSPSWFPIPCLSSPSWFPAFVPCNHCRSAPTGVEPQTPTHPSG